MDRSTKILLLANAAGLWANAAVYAIGPARADSYLLTGISSTLGAIERNISDIATGRCGNQKLCQRSFQ